MSPCIESKIKHALGLPNRHRGNKKVCSVKYWNNHVTRIGNEKNLPFKLISEAQSKYQDYMKNTYKI